MSYPLLAVDNLACIREERLLFEKLSFALEAGSLVQLEGPNGVGKSSLLAILAGLSSPLEGEVRYRGQPLVKVRAQYYEDLLFLGHKSGVNPVLSPLENLRFYQQVLPSHDLDLWELLDLVGLFGMEELPVGQLSAGQQRRVALARLWLSKASCWLLDEPFTAIDALGVKKLEARLEEHCQQGGLVVLTTHQSLALAPALRLNLAMAA